MKKIMLLIIMASLFLCDIPLAMACTHINPYSQMAKSIVGEVVVSKKHINPYRALAKYLADNLKGVIE